MSGNCHAGPGTTTASGPKRRSPLRARTAAGSRPEGVLLVALAGNPNAGKSTLFNALTGLHQHVGNWPGKTVARREGRCRANGQEFRLIDLPGTYSLTARAPDEQAARDFLVREPPDLIINVVDACNLERNLYLTLQLLELNRPLVIALNMIDAAQAQGLSIDLERLSALLGGVTVVPTAANRAQGLRRLLQSAVATACASPDRENADLVRFHPGITSARSLLERRLAAEALRLAPYRPAWVALQLLEGDQAVAGPVATLENGRAILSAAQNQAQLIEHELGEQVAILTADSRYAYIANLARQVLHQPGLRRRDLTRRIDDVVTHRIWGLPLFLLVMYLVFRLVVDVAAPFLDWIEALVHGPAARWASWLLSGLATPAWLTNLVLDGALAGAGAVLVFVPGLMVLYFFLAFLEDSGYLARAAFVTDRLMRTIGLPGKAIIPLILGFGCAVPAIYATRTIAGRRDRLLTALLVPFMSCSARLPVYVVFGLAFFGSRAGTIIWALYVLGIIAALLSGAIFSRTVLNRPDQTLVGLEMPPYRLPALQGLVWHTWHHTSAFVRRAGTTILLLSMVLWLLLNLPWGVQAPADSLFGRASARLAPLLSPAGFGTWEATGSLLTGLAAKEMVVSTLAQIYVPGQGEAETAVVAGDGPSWAALGRDLAGAGTGFGQAIVEAGRQVLFFVPGISHGRPAELPDRSLARALEGGFSPASALSFLVFVLLYVPCVATMAALGQEFGRRWAVWAAAYQTGLAWLAAVLAFQGARLAGWG